MTAAWPKGGWTMTLMGKIMCVFVLIFSLVQGAFAVMLYTARTQWSTWRG